MQQRIDLRMDAHSLRDRDLQTWRSQFNESLNALDVIMVKSWTEICAEEEFVKQKIDELQELLKEVTVSLRQCIAMPVSLL